MQPIAEQLKETSIWVALAICIAAILYCMVEGWITYSFARQYSSEFNYAMGVESAFYCSFYRVATLGSGAGVAALYYFNEKGIPISRGTGMYMVQYVLHKVSIAIFSGIFFLISWQFMIDHYAAYAVTLIFGYGITFLVAIVLILFCCSKKFHGLLFWIADKINKNGKFDDKIARLHEECEMLENATAYFLKKKGFTLGIIAKNLLKFFFWYSIPFIVLCQTSNMTLLEALAITSLSVMLAAVIPTPAGIGSTEIVLTMLLAEIVGTGAAGSATLLYRFATFVFPFLIGTIVVVLRRRVAKRLQLHKKEN